MKTIGSLLIALVLMAGMLSCGEIIDNGDGNGNGNGNGTVSHQLTVSSTAGGSVVEPGDGVHVYEEGTVVDLVAQPDTGHRFVSWTGDAGSVADVDAASTTITINGDYYITASFEEISEETPVVEYELTVDSTSGGEVTIPGEGTLTFDDGTVVELVAEADEGYEFVNWTGDVDTIADVDAASTTIIMDGDYAITANFEQILPFQYNLTISSTGGGTVTKPGEGTFAYDEGTVVSLSASPAGGYYFVNWTGGVATLANVNAASTTITVTDDLAIMANFSVTPVTYYTLTMAVSGSGATSPAVGQHTFSEGTLVSIIANPAGGWRFVNWSGSVGGVANVNSASTTITMNGNYSITANFEEEAAAVYFADANLEAAIREAIAKPTGDIYPSDLEGLTSFDAGGKYIGDLTGLEHCTKLTYLILINNQIIDLSPLANLTNLTYLHLGGNQISDTLPLANLTGLYFLSLGVNQINDVSSLASLTGVIELALSENQISDISPLASLISLRKLHLANNAIDDVSPLASLVSLRELFASSNQIDNISPLAGLTSVTRLNLDHNQVFDISPLAGLINMVNLYLSDNQISNLSALVGLSSLTTLSLRYNQISDISPLLDNHGLGEGDIVDLRWNPLSEQSINEYIPALQARGVTVDY